MAEEKMLVGVATNAHSTMDFNVHYNHSYIFQEWAQKYELKMIGYQGALAADARELICEEAVKEGVTHLVFIDADHIIHTDTLDLLLESKDEAMVSGLICRRYYPFGQVGFGQTRDGMWTSIDLPLDGKLYEVGACAFGCTLINMIKLQKLEKPWFRDTCVKNAKGDLANMRSDINICEAFRARGEQVWIDTRILVGHLGVNLTVYPQNAEDLKNFSHQYYESFKLREGQVGKYALLPRLL